MYEPTITDDGVEATIIHVDGFGNMVTNITYDVLNRMGVNVDSVFDVEISGKKLKLPYVRRFSAVPEGELLTVVAGGGYMEFAVNQGNAHNRLGVGKGEKVRITPR